uniref:EF-hand domain-containing protein n=1 Tax=Tetraselmis sp. GSL018 TaxID=582737 RepID=A0A061QRC5_9CHLO|mmetsp:Transcript_24672/g.58728  ORF Transcript_24672/g.58728 Transcript_24672/m.58728 type:complete len:156 (-) Transcript_24672:1107-1574(-)
MGLFKDKKLFRKFCENSFKKCDYDGTGYIEVKELHIGLLMLYDQINDLLPIHIDVPTHDQVIELVKKGDKDENGTLNFDEYFEICKMLFFTKRNWKNSLVLRVLINLGFKMIAFPVAGALIKKGGMKLGIPGFGFVAEGFFVTGVEIAATAVKPL